MRSPRDLQRYGGLLCLDFLNTVDWRGRERPEEYLNTYADLIEWSALAGALTPVRARTLRARATAKAAGAVLKHAVAFREAAYRLANAILNRQAPSAADLDAVNDVIAQARSRGKLEHRSGTFSWAFSGDDLNLPLWTISLSFADLLTSGQLQYVRLCGGPECGWLFLDTTKNHKRRWCSMEGCGNRAKARRHYASLG